MRSPLGNSSSRHREGPPSRLSSFRARTKSQYEVDKVAWDLNNPCSMTTSRLHTHSGTYARFFGFVYFGA